MGLEVDEGIRREEAGASRGTPFSSSSRFDIGWLPAAAAAHALRIAQLAPEEARRARQRVAAGGACRRDHLAAVLHHALNDAYFAHEVHEEQHYQKNKANQCGRTATLL
jgi:hypothetical protein